MAKDVLGVGIIGCGTFCTAYLATLGPVYKTVKVVACSDIDMERANKIAKEWGVPHPCTTDELLADPEVDIAVIVTGPGSHYPLTMQALRAGKHVYCEKPMSHSPIEAEKMVEAWKKSGKQFTVGYQNRFRGEVQNLHAACEKGELGDIYYGKAHAIRRRGVPTWGVFMDKAAQGGGPLIDIGTHALDITLWCMD